MSVHENDKTVAHIAMIGNPELATVVAAESAVAAFKLALKELGERVPANDVRAVLTTSGLRLEVTAAPTTSVEHYGTPAPVEEIAEFIAGKHYSAEALSLLHPGKRVVDRSGDVWEKVDARRWVFVNPETNRVGSSNALPCEALVEFWGPIGAEAA